MADLQEPLSHLGPIDYASVPSEEESLRGFLQKHLAAAHLLIESVPPPLEPSAPIARGRSSTVGAGPTAPGPSPKKMSASAVLPGPGSLPGSGLQPQWGKPVKIAAKDNALAIPVYKLAAKDGRGAWFARRSAHSGLSFERWKEAIRREFPTSLAVQGAPGEGNVRGIGADERLERRVVEGVAKIDVYRLTAQFPGPTTPRDFVELLISSETAPEGHWGGKNEHLLVISKPCAHPDAEPSSRFIRGAYESVEYIRKVPLLQRPRSISEQNLTILDTVRDDHTLTHSTSSPNRSPTNGGQAGSETHLVEWIHITRSDPGGSVPRFMVERGTPGSMVADAKKFVDWAGTIPLDGAADGVEEANADATGDGEAASVERGGAAAPGKRSTTSLPTLPTQPPQDNQAEKNSASAILPGGSSACASPAATTSAGGSWEMYGEDRLRWSLSRATQAAFAQLEAYAPRLTAQFGRSEAPPLERRASIVPSPRPDRRFSSSSSSDGSSDAPSGSSDGSFASAAASPILSPAHTVSSDPTRTEDGDGERKEAAQIAALTASHTARLASLAADLASAREKHGSGPKRTDKAEAQYAKSVAKAEAQHGKAVEQLRAAVRKEQEKAEREAKRQAEKQERAAKRNAQRDEAHARKAEKKRLEREEREMRRTREREEKNERALLRRQVTSLQDELDRIRAEKDRVAQILKTLQGENTALIARLENLAGGRELVHEVKRGGGLAPVQSGEGAGSTKSGHSGISTTSGRSG